MENIQKINIKKISKKTILQKIITRKNIKILGIIILIIILLFTFTNIIGKNKTNSSVEIKNIIQKMRSGAELTPAEQQKLDNFKSKNAGKSSGGMRSK